MSLSELVVSRGVSLKVSHLQTAQLSGNPTGLCFGVSVEVGIVDFLIICGVEGGFSC